MLDLTERFVNTWCFDPVLIRAGDCAFVGVYGEKETQRHVMMLWLKDCPRPKTNLMSGENKLALLLLEVGLVYSQAKLMV